MDIREVTYLAIALRILAAVVFDGLLGLERGMKNRPAGLRTYMLVCVGSCVIMLTNQYIFQAFGSGDPVRMGSQVVSGIGFLGAGTIIVTQRNQIKGLTTAAGLWAAAGVGLALGVGFYEGALVGAAAVFVVMTLLQRMDNQMHRKNKHIEIYLELRSDASLGDFLRHVRQQDVEVHNVQREQDTANCRAYIATLKSQKCCSHIELIDEIARIDGVAYLEEL